MIREEEIRKACEEIYNKLVLDGMATPKEFGEACMKWAYAHLLSPWISVKDKLPEDGQIIVSYITQTISGGGEKNVEHQMALERYKGRFTCDRMEQQRMGGYMFDIVVKTTHWLPMPQSPEAL